MPIRGFVRMRRHQFGKQSALLTPVPATRRVGARGVPDINPNWTEVENVDTGSIDPLLPPYRAGMTVGLPLAFDPLSFEDIPLIMGSLIEGGVTPTPGAAEGRTWVQTAKSTTPTILDFMTNEFMDDVNLNDDVLEDAMQLIGGIVQRAEWSFDATLGPWVMNTDWMFATAKPHTTPTPGLLLPTDIPWAYGEDTALYIDDTPGAIGTTKIVDSLVGATISIEHEIDEKRFANGLEANPEDRFSVDAYGVAGRTISATMRFEKTAQIVDASDSETVDWFAGDAVPRYVRLETTSTAEAEAGVPYSWQQDLAGTWMTRTESEEGGNAIVELTLTGRLDETLGFPFRSTVVNTRDDTP